MISTWTNLTWPDDPYRTGQQLYRKPAPRLAAFVAWPDMAGEEPFQPFPRTVAIAYLPLHRTRPVAVTGQTLAFGFRAATASGPMDAPDVAALADLDLLQARRHAAVLAGYHLADELTMLRQGDEGTVYRGLAAVAGDWAGRTPRVGQAAMFDCDLDLPGSLPLGQACRQAGISPMGVRASALGGRHPATLAVERALTIALLCARHQGRYEWDGTLDTESVMSASAWDCLPWPPAAGSSATGTALAAADRRQRQ